MESHIIKYHRALSIFDIVGVRYERLDVQGIGRFGTPLLHQSSVTGSDFCTLALYADESKVDRLLVYLLCHGYVRGVGPFDCVASVECGGVGLGCKGYECCR